MDSVRETCCDQDLGLTGQEEGVVLVSGRVLLGLEQGVEVPKGALYEVVGRHLTEAADSSELMLQVCVCQTDLLYFLLLTPSPGRSA